MMSSGQDVETETDSSITDGDAEISAKLHEVEGKTSRGVGTKTGDWGPWVMTSISFSPSSRSVELLSAGNRLSVTVKEGKMPEGIPKISLIIVAMSMSSNVGDVARGMTVRSRRTDGTWKNPGVGRLLRHSTPEDGYGGRTINE